MAGTLQHTKVIAIFRIVFNYKINFPTKTLDCLLRNLDFNLFLFDRPGMPDIESTR